MRLVLVYLLLVFTGGCSVKWADDMAEKGHRKEMINDYDTAMKFYNKGI